MITEDQPTIFDNLPVKVTVSSLQDGQTHPKHGNKQAIFKNITNVTGNSKTVLMRTVYENRRYDLIVDVDNQTPVINPRFEPMVKADALVTSTPGTTLALPVADCLAVALFDPKNKVSAIAHTGRHSTLENLLLKLIEHMKNKYGTEAKDLLAYFSPSIKKSHYFMEYWDETQMSDYFEKENDVYYLDIPGFNKNQLVQAGVLPENIEISPVNTATSENYGSHFMHKVDPDKPDDRFLVAITLAA